MSLTSTKLSVISQMKESADELVALAELLWDICCNEYDVHCILDATGSWHFTGPLNTFNHVIAAEAIAKELEKLRANMDDWDFNEE